MKLDSNIYLIIASFIWIVGSAIACWYSGKRNIDSDRMFAMLMCVMLGAAVWPAVLPIYLIVETYKFIYRIGAVAGRKRQLELDIEDTKAGLKIAFPDGMEESMLEKRLEELTTMYKNKEWKSYTGIY